MLEGKCHKCGFYGIGWALYDKRHRKCPKCGTSLEVIDHSHATTNTLSTLARPLLRLLQNGLKRQGIITSKTKRGEGTLIRG